MSFVTSGIVAGGLYATNILDEPSGVRLGLSRMPLLPQSGGSLRLSMRGLSDASDRTTLPVLFLTHLLLGPQSLVGVVVLFLKMEGAG